MSYLRSIIEIIVHSHLLYSVGCVAHITDNIALLNKLASFGRLESLKKKKKLLNRSLEFILCFVFTFESLVQYFTIVSFGLKCLGLGFEFRLRFRFLGLGLGS